MTSIIKVDQIQTAAGATPTADSLGINTAGTVLQVVSNQNISSSWIGTSSTSMVSSGITQSITAKRTGSSLRVNFIAPMAHATTGHIRIGLSRNDIGQRGTAYSFGYQNKDQNQYQPMIIDYVDTQTVTQGVTYTYTITFLSEQGQTTYLVHNSSGYYLHVTEIAG
jgi:hypothetical protein